MDFPKVGQFFNVPTYSSINQSGKGEDRDPQQGGMGYDQQNKREDATEEEAKNALAQLVESDEFKKLGFSFEVVSAENSFEIQVKDSSGKEVRVMKGRDIIRLLENGNQDTKLPNRGKLLDRRV